MLGGFGCWRLLATYLIKCLKELLLYPSATMSKLQRVSKVYCHSFVQVREFHMALLSLTFTLPEIC